MASITRGVVLLLMAVLLLFLLSVLAVGPCSKSGTRTIDVVETTPNSIGEAEATVGFPIVVPAYLPTGVGANPQIFVSQADDLNEVTLLYGDFAEDSGDAGGLLITIEQFEGNFSVFNGDQDPRTIRVGETEVRLAADISLGGRAEMIALWSRGTVTFETTFEWSD